MVRTRALVAVDRLLTSCCERNLTVRCEDAVVQEERVTQKCLFDCSVFLGTVQVEELAIRSV